MGQNRVEHFIQRNLGRLGLEIHRAGYHRNVMNFIADREIDTVVDVGANQGQFAKTLRAQGYRGKIMSFEPVPTVYATLVKTAAPDPDWDTKNFALGAEAGTAAINVATSSVFSSILPSAAAARHYTNATAVERTETVQIRKLDDVVPTTSGNIMLKIDTQGYEKQVLEGGRQTLRMAKGVLMELPVIHLYEQTWQFHEAVAFMAEAGFVPAQIHPVTYHSVDKESLVEVDCLFRPRDPRVD
jgi:FkbM family methyltransferase